ncbi:unknown [Bacteroides sp. CAG:927]|nr:unknown [Bacteroides sp. CAG:927]
MRHFRTSTCEVGRCKESRGIKRKTRDIPAHLAKSEDAKRAAEASAGCAISGHTPAKSADAKSRGARDFSITDCGAPVARSCRTRTLKQTP